MKLVACGVLLLGTLIGALAGEWVVYEGKDGPGKGKHIVLLSGDEEYRSEEAMPMLGKILAERHGFKCTVLFAINPASGEIDPKYTKNVPGMDALKTADLVMLNWRFRELPDEQMQHFVDYFSSGKPIIALRTSTHAFNYSGNSTSKFKKYHWQSKDWPGGFGKQVLGETWVAHHGAHKKEATRGIIEAGAKEHPILKGVDDIFGDSDVYTVNLPADAEILVRGQVLKGMKPEDAPVEGKKNEPMQPVVWVRNQKNEAGTTNKVVVTTMGAATDLQNEGLRRLLVNSAYWTLGIPVPDKTDVRYVGEFKPSMYGFDGFRKGVKPAEHELK
ncbi:MAG TPA: ThuA domain-containing protein [Verrucomicrobiae bacterium]